MQKQWLQISAVWLSVLVMASYAAITLTQDQALLVFSLLAAGSVAVVSLEHLIRASVAQTVRQMVYVSSGSFVILAIATAFVMLG